MDAIEDSFHPPMPVCEDFVRSAKDMVTERWSREVVAREIIRLSKESPDLRHNEIASKNSRLVSAAIRYFGSWGAAVSAAGFDYVSIRRESQLARAAKITKWSHDRINEEIKKLVESGECLAAATARTNHPALFSAAVSPRYYGSWRDALTANGVDYDAILDQSRSTPGRVGETRGTRSIARKLRLMTQNDHTLSSEEAQARYPRLYKRAVSRFGSWEAATKAAHAG